MRSRTLLRASALLGLLVSQSFTYPPTENTDPDFGPNVTIFDPTTPSAAIQAKLDSVFKSQESNEFGTERFALLFKPGTYDVDARVGYYTQLSGLGLSPDQVVINGGVRADARWRNGNATVNFWRIAENMSVNPTGGFDQWAVSQAAPMRRMHIRGDLVLDDGGWSSGGFLGDSKVDGQVRSGSQQQWLTRNSSLGSWTGSNWNMVFVGTVNAPPSSFPTPPYTTIGFAPVIREKPFLYVDTRSGEWKVFVPAMRSNASGTTWESGKAPGVAHPISEFSIVKPGASARTMNDALARNKNLIITPGIYHLDAPLHITRANTVVLGLGLATLVPDNGVSAINVDDVDGVTIAGLLIDAGAINSPVLVQVGPPGSSANHSSNPSLLSDVFFRIGGAGVGRATQSLVINSNDVIGDHMWLWRADHGKGVGWTSNTAANGLVVNGRNVTMYGLFVEHYQQYQVQWNGNGGRTYFFQNEMPYDVPNQAEWMSGATRGFS
ncbi:MAG TPA: coagulation factor 5/8 type domain-containing protein, partial [Gemmatimonadaceae bacterium]|nr:coagulation factor 5/8 type domain-containing protein [Gemmatimonadaceae bacterium]